MLIASINSILLVKELKKYNESAEAYKNLQQLIEKEEVTDNKIENLVQNEIQSTNKQEEKNKFSVDFDKLKEISPEIIGWIMQENTSINYPIMQTDNNEYYLNHLYDGTKNKSGSIYMDYENKSNFKDYNTIIYGHNMNDGAMFASLLGYQKQDYYDKNKTMNLITPEGEYTIEIFSAFIAQTSEAGTENSPWNIKWETYEIYSNWFSKMQERSLITTDTLVAPGDKIITFSTCTPTGKDRFIVMGKLVNMNET